MGATELQSDLHFVRAAVERSQEPPVFTRLVLWYWSAYVFVGYALIDIRPDWANLWFAAMAIVGAVFCGWLWRRGVVEHGIRDAASDRREALHWASGLFIVAGVASLAVIHREFRGMVAGQLVAFMFGLIYYLAGVHGDRRMLWLGILFMIGAIAISFVPILPWTLLGAVIAAGLSFMAWQGGRATSARIEPGVGAAVDPESGYV